MLAAVGDSGSKVSNSPAAGSAIKQRVMARQMLSAERILRLQALT